VQQAQKQPLCRVGLNFLREDQPPDRGNQQIPDDVVH